MTMGYNINVHVCPSNITAGCSCCSCCSLLTPLYYDAVDLFHSWRASWLLNLVDEVLTKNVISFANSPKKKIKIYIQSAKCKIMMKRSEIRFSERNKIFR